MKGACVGADLNHRRTKLFSRVILTVQDFCFKHCFYNRNTTGWSFVACWFSCKFLLLIEH